MRQDSSAANQPGSMLLVLSSLPAFLPAFLGHGARRGEGMRLVCMQAGFLEWDTALFLPPPLLLHSIPRQWFACACARAAVLLKDWPAFVILLTRSLPLPLALVHPAQERS